MCNIHTNLLLLSHSPCNFTTAKCRRSPLIGACLILPACTANLLRRFLRSRNSGDKDG